MVQPVVEFYYDIQCPWAYIASTRIEAIARNTGALLIWKPVLLGHIYELTRAPQGKAGSATDVMPAAKRAIHELQFAQTVARYNVNLKYHPDHPVRTVDADRLLHATPPSYRSALTHALYNLYWVQNADISNRDLLLRTASSLNIPYPQPLTDAVFTNSTFTDALRETTAEVVRRGAAGVPCFWITALGAAANEGTLFWGQDRLHFVAASLHSLGLTGSTEAWDRVPHIFSLYPRLVPVVPASILARKRKLNFFFDFASPWSYLGFTQMGRLLKEAGPGVEVEWIPITLGGLFKAIGTQMLPAAALPEARRKYSRKDMQDWIRYWRVVLKQAGEDPDSVDRTVSITWPTKFPIHSMLSLRIALLESDPKLKEVIYRACWVDDLDVADPEVLADVITKGGFDGPGLVSAAQQNIGNVKQRLVENNQRAVSEGVCGAPTWSVEIDGERKGGGMIWGQDQLNVVADLLGGWPEVQHSSHVHRL